MNDRDDREGAQHCARADTKTRSCGKPRVCLGLGRLVQVRPHNITWCQSKMSPSCKQQDRCRCMRLRRRGHPSSPHPPCSRCGTSHGSKWEACPAHRQKCHACGRREHYAQFRRTGSSPTSASSRTNAARRPKSYGRKNGTSAERNVSSVDAVAEDFATLTFEVVEISDISTENIITAQVQFNLDYGRVNLRGKVDTGAQGNTCPSDFSGRCFLNESTKQDVHGMVR